MHNVGASQLRRHLETQLITYKNDMQTSPTLFKKAMAGLAINFRKRSQKHIILAYGLERSGHNSVPTLLHLTEAS